MSCCSVAPLGSTRSILLVLKISTRPRGDLESVIQNGLGIPKESFYEALANDNSIA